VGDKDFSIYVHIPYCLQKCPYCDFNTFAAVKWPENEYVDAVLAELQYYSRKPEWKNQKVSTVFFGGGTPSIFSPESLGKVIQKAKELFSFSDNCEISMEANPGSLKLETLAEFHKNQINRISFGVQSFHQKTLDSLGRFHNADQSKEAISLARKAGFKNISVDIMFGAPNQTIEELEHDLNIISNLKPDHVSAYSLTIEKGTPFFQSYSKGILKLPTDELFLEMMSLISINLSAEGFNRYEISNYSKPGYESLHNKRYWDRYPYLGLGAGAHSFEKTSNQYGKRWSNLSSPEKYISEIQKNGFASSWNEILSEKEAYFEFFFTGLRNIKGVSLCQFKEEFGIDSSEIYGENISRLINNNLLERKENFLLLTKKGIEISDSVLESFLNETKTSLKIYE